MTPIDQTLFGMPHGNCMQACIASVLDIALDDVPKPPLPKYHVGWFEDYCESLAAIGVALVTVEIQGIKWNVPHGLICIVSGPGPRNQEDGTPIEHAVVGRARREGDSLYFDIIHDPHPSRAGLLEVRAVDFVIRL